MAFGGLWSVVETLKHRGLSKMTIYVVSSGRNIDPEEFDEVTAGALDDFNQSDFKPGSFEPIPARSVVSEAVTTTREPRENDLHVGSDDLYRKVTSDLIRIAADLRKLERDDSAAVQLARDAVHLRVLGKHQFAAKLERDFAEYYKSKKMYNAMREALLRLAEDYRNCGRYADAIAAAAESMRPFDDRAASSMTIDKAKKIIASVRSQGRPSVNR